MSADHWSEDKVGFGSRQLSYRHGGVGNPLLVIHDLGEPPVPPAELRTCAYVYAPDLPGFGDSTALAGEHNVSKLAWALLKFLQTMQVSEVDVMACGF